MREFTDRVSFLNRQSTPDISRVFLVDKPKSFNYFVSLKNKIIKKLLNIPAGEILLLNSDEPHGIRALFEGLKESGLIYYYGEGALFSDYPKFNYVGIFYNSDKGIADDTQTAWGYCLIEDGKELAFSKVLGECLERQASYYDPKVTNVVYPKLHEGDASFIYEYVPKFTANQIKKNQQLIATAQDLKNILGFKARSLTGDKARFLPFEAFYWGKQLSSEQKIFCHSTTSGSGGGSTYEQAVLSALYESIERDHFMLYWLSGIQPKIIDNLTITGTFGEYIKDCEKAYNLEVYFLDLKYDFNVLTSVCVIVDPVLNLVTMGAKTGRNGDEVLKGAFLEAMAVLCAARDNESRDGNMGLNDEERKKIFSSEQFTTNITRRQRVNLYASADGIELLRKNFLKGEKETYNEFMDNLTTVSETKDDLEYILSEFKKRVTEKGKGYHAYIHEFSSRWTKQLGYHAVHVFVPALLKLYLKEVFATPVSSRLIEFAEQKGKTIRDENDFNKLPHFFP